MDALLSDISPVFQALIATGFSWFMTAVGSAFVFFFKAINKRVFDTMLGFAAGVMLAASFWSLLAPSIEMSGELGLPIWMPPLIGFLAGGLFLKLADSFLPHLHIGPQCDQVEGLRCGWKRTVLLITAITLHNIPEGLAVGVAIGAATNNLGSATIASALILALGMGLQNLPEGAAVSIPLRREGLSRLKSFWYGQLSGLVEPVAGVLGVVAVMAIKPVLPYALSFAAGAMIYVVVEELLPEAQSSSNSDYSTIGCILGFALMMVLDITLG
ncbi:MAG: ZIP family metal transporter [Acetivibrionales bacterium]|nr:ZIP family metal transporter [Bacillota bacterium]HOA54866.1 ZIP family metal transporter [Clostridiales bacterium]HPZ06196.1 ZIP family metal transporter [Clostridiales bacterium]HQD31229.1 ZIP family metal transporter [Clostridiales bacterium]